MNELKALRKRLAVRPSAAIAALQADVDSEANRRALVEASDLLSRLVENQSTLMDERSARSAAIGKLKRAGQPVDKEISVVSELSDRLKILQICIDESIEGVLHLVEPESGTTRSGSQRTESVAATGHSAGISGELAETGSARDKRALPAGPGQFRTQPESHRSCERINLSRLETTEPHDQQQREDWNRYVASHPGATHYHHLEWCDLIESRFASRCIYLMARDVDGNVVGVLAAVMMKSRLFGSFLLSMPFLIYGGPLADDAGVSKALAEHLSSLAVAEGATRTELRETHARPDWHAMTDKVSMILTLPDDLVQLNAGLGAKVRSQVRRAAREPLTFEIGGYELVDGFYRVFSEKMRDLGTPVYPRGFFEAILQRFPDSARIAMVKRHDEVVAAALIIRFRDTMEVPWAASKRKYDTSSVNMYLYHHLLETAQQEGCRYFDFGRSTVDGPTFRFKRQWGAEPYTLYWHSRAAPGHALPEQRGTGMVMKLAIRVWQYLPLPVANALGPLVAVKLPW